jgi:hypothetical protein
MSSFKIKNILTKFLGAIWLFDGLLQFQPKMFGPAFSSQVLVPLLQNQPSIIQSFVHFGMFLWNTNTVWTDTAAGILQCAIGILLLLPSSKSNIAIKFGLWVSIVWGIIVWIFGEGFGMIFTGSASFYTGAPGAVLAYVLLAILILVPKGFSVKFYAKVLGWSFIFLSFLQLQPTFWTSTGIQSLFTGSGDSFSIVNTFPTYLSQVAGAHSISANILLLLISLILGILLILKPSRISASFGLVFLLLVWWIGQDFGQLTSLISGVPTDPNMAPLFALFLLPLFLNTSSRL